MNAVVIHSDRKWDLAGGTATQHYAYQLMCDLFDEDFATAGPLPRQPYDEAYGEYDAIFVILPWPRINKTPLQRLWDLSTWAGRSHKKLVLIADDYNQLRASQPFVGPWPHALVTNFGCWSEAWKLAPQLAITYAKYPTSMIRASAVEPKFDYGYVGQKIGPRHTILKSLKMPITLIGPAWSQQSDLACCHDKGVLWQDLGDVYRLSRHNLSVQHSRQAAMQPYVSRFAEAWACGCHVWIHESHMLGTHIKWKWAFNWLFSTADDLAMKRMIFDATYGDDPRAAARAQAEQLSPLLYPPSTGEIERLKEWLG